MLTGTLEYCLWPRTRRLMLTADVEMRAEDATGNDVEVHCISAKERSKIGLASDRIGASVKFEFTVEGSSIKSIPEYAKMLSRRS